VDCIANYLPWTTYPNVDGFILDVPPLTSFRRGGNKAVTVVYGTTSNEYSMIFSTPGEIAAASIPNHQFVLGLSRLDVNAGLADVWAATMAAPNLTTIKQDIYSDFTLNSDPEEWSTHIQMANDVWFGRTIDKGSRALMQGGSTRVYKMLYMFGVTANVAAAVDELGYGPLSSFLGAYHAGEDSSDMGFYEFGYDWFGLVFGVYASTGRQMDWASQEIKMASAIMHYWKNIMATGDPNSDGTEYPVWAANSEMTMGFSPSFTDGAAFGACIRLHPCVSESLATFRKFHYDYYDAYTAGTTAVTGTGPTCAAPWVEAGVPDGITVKDNFGLTLLYPPGVNHECSTCSCPGRRSMLFGASSLPPTTCSCV